MQEKFFTTEQVANILQVHPFTILKFIKQGKLKGIKLGRVYRIKESDVEKFLEERMTQPKKAKPAEGKKKEKAPPVAKGKSEEVSDRFKIEAPSDDQPEDHYYII